MSKWNLDKVYKAMVKAKSDLPDVLANQSVRFFKNSFKIQGFEDTTVKHWKQSKRVQQKGGSTLVKSGRLRRSIKIKTATFKRIVIYTDVPYAEVNNEGFKGAVRVKSYVNRNGVKVQSHTRNMNMPKRQFMGVSKTLMNKHENTIDKAIKECFKA